MEKKHLKREKVLKLNSIMERTMKSIWLVAALQKSKILIFISFQVIWK